MAAVVAARPVSFTITDQQAGITRKFDTIPNSNPKLFNRDGTQKTKTESAVEFAESAYGAFRILQLLEKTARVAIHVLKGMGASMIAAVAYLERIASGLTRAWTLLIIPRLLDVTTKAKTAIVEWINPPVIAPVDANRDKVQKVHDIAEAGTALGHAAAFFAPHPAIKNVTEVTGLVSDVMDLQMATQDLRLADSHLAVIDRAYPNNAASHNQLVYTKRLALLKMAKSVAAVISGVLGLIALILGATLVSPVFLLGCGTVSASLAVMAHFYKERSPYPIVDFFHRSILAPQPQVAAVHALAAAGA